MAISVQRRFLKIFLILGTVALASACQKKTESTVYTNCKLTNPSLYTQVGLGGFPINPYRLTSTGTVKATILFVDYPDAPASMTAAQAYALISGAAATFAEQSYSRLTYQMSPHLQWLRMSQTSTAYQSSNDLAAQVREAVSLADSAVDFSQTQSLVVIRNPSVTVFPNGPSYPGAPGAGVTADGNEMYNFVISGYDLNTWGSIWLTHEVTHTLGLPDLYTYSQAYPDLLYDAGKFSYMGFNSFTSNAPGLTAWERWVLGWLDDSQMLCANPRSSGAIETTVTPVETSGGQKAVVVPIGDTKAIVVESRRASGIDANIAKEGALVYTVDTSIGTGAGPLKVFPKGGTSDPYSTTAPRAAGESVTISGIKIEVLASDTTGDQIRITADKLWIDR